MKATKEASIYEGDAVLFPKPDAAWLEQQSPEGTGTCERCGKDGPGRTLKSELLGVEIFRCLGCFALTQSAWLALRNGDGKAYRTWIELLSDRNRNGRASA
jgi:hypothetical protein